MKLEKECDEANESGSMAGAETPNYITKVLSRQCTKSLKKSQKICSSTGCLKSINGDVILEKEKKSQTDVQSA